MKKIPKARKLEFKSRNPEKTKSRILAKAFKLFAERGFEGTSLDDIVDAAKVNKRMVYHYFEDKAGLYRSLFVEIWGGFKENVDELYNQQLHKHGSIPQDIKGVIVMALSVLSDMLSSNHDYVRLIMWEGLEGGHISKSIWAELRGPLFAQISFLLREAQVQGKIDENLDVAHLIISYLGATFFYYAYAPTLADVFGKNPLSEEALVERKSQMELFLQKLFKA